MLVVESDPGRRIRLAEILSKHHVSVLLAPDVATAESIVQHQQVAAVVLDGQARDHGSLRERLCLHGLHVDTPILVLDESCANDASVLQLESIYRPNEQHAADGASQSSAAQTSLLYALPHEYRTPLTDIIGQSAMLQGHATDMTSEEIRESTTDILRSARRLLRITDNFLLFAQLETLGESPFHVQRMRQYTTPCADSIIRDAIRERVHARNREADITCSTVTPGVSVNIMPQYLTSIVAEIVDNACAFSTPGSPIRIDVACDATTLSVRVCDAGVGMSTEECSSIGPYRQFRRSSQEQQGVGLGLTIAKRLLELHAGNLSITSEQHVGTTVTVTLPRADVGTVDPARERVSAPATGMVLAYA